MDRYFWSREVKVQEYHLHTDHDFERCLLYGSRGGTLFVTTYDLLVITYYLLLITYLLLLTTYYLFVITYYLLVITYYLLVITYWLLLTMFLGHINRRLAQQQTRFKEVGE